MSVTNLATDMIGGTVYFEGNINKIILKRALWSLQIQALLQ